MANPVPVTYSASASPVAGGRFVWPAWRRGRTPMSVFAIPASNTLDDLNPRYDPAINPVYPSKPEWMGTHAGIISAWCGACWGEEVGELWLPLSGGHADYAGNEPYYISLFSAAPKWVMPRPPSGAIGNLLTTNDGQELTGVYSDGRPRAIHSYNKPVWIPGVGPTISMQGSTSYSVQGPSDHLQINRVTGEATRFAFASPPFGGAATSGMGACYDATRNAIWAAPAGTGRYARLSLASMVWESVGITYVGSGNRGVCYIPEYDCLFDVCNYYSNKFVIYDCATLTRHAPSVSGGAAAVAAWTGSQPIWVPEIGAVAVWDNAAENAHKITLFTPTGDPRTDGWVISTLDFEISDQPTARSNNGTYGRFFYSHRLGGFGVINATAQPIYFFALR